MKLVNFADMPIGSRGRYNGMIVYKVSEKHVEFTDSVIREINPREKIDITDYRRG